MRQLKGINAKGMIYIEYPYDGKIGTENLKHHIESCTKNHE